MIEVVGSGEVCLTLVATPTLFFFSFDSIQLIFPPQSNQDTFWIS